ncbi:MAG: hypothetical protein AAFX50_13460, partial [Acidobacteriota bacterium]
MDPNPPPVPDPRALALGDTHNFGRCVTRRGDRIVKPRPVLWEQLLLDAESPLRRRLDAAARQSGDAGAFAFLPDVKFYPPRSGTGGEVDAIRLEPLGSLGDGEVEELARITGRSLALWSWLGVTDLHWENLVLGRDARGQIVFTPLDIEGLFDDLAMPTETKLLPDADPEYAEISRHAAGVRRVLPYLGKPVSASTLLTTAAAY